MNPTRKKDIKGLRSAEGKNPRTNEAAENRRNLTRNARTMIDKKGMMIGEKRNITSRRETKANEQDKQGHA